MKRSHFCTIPISAILIEHCISVFHLFNAAFTSASFFTGLLPDSVLCFYDFFVFFFLFATRLAFCSPEPMYLHITLSIFAACLNLASSLAPCRAATLLLSTGMNCFMYMYALFCVDLPRL